MSDKTTGAPPGLGHEPVDDLAESLAAAAVADDNKRTVRPTKRQQELLLFIGQFIAEHGYSPSYREIMNGCHYTSVATVALHVNNLIKRGHLRKRDHSARSLEVVQPAEATAAGDTADADDNWLLQQTAKKLAKLEKASEVGADDLADIRVLLQAAAILELYTEPLLARFEALQNPPNGATDKAQA